MVEQGGAPAPTVSKPLHPDDHLSPARAPRMRHNPSGDHRAPERAAHQQCPRRRLPGQRPPRLCVLRARHPGARRRRCRTRRRAVGVVGVRRRWPDLPPAALDHSLGHGARGEGAVRRALPAVAGFSSSGSRLVVTVTSWLARDLLFHDDGLAFPLLAGAVALGSGVLGVVRGILTARRRFLAVGVGLVTENALRCLAAVALIAARRPQPHGVRRLPGRRLSRRRPLARRRSGSPAFRQLGCRRTRRSPSSAAPRQGRCWPRRSWPVGRFCWRRPTAPRRK